MNHFPAVIATTIETVLADLKRTREQHERALVDVDAAIAEWIGATTEFLAHRTASRKPNDVFGRRRVIEFIAKAGHLGVSQKQTRHALGHSFPCVRRWFLELASEGVIEKAPGHCGDLWRLALPNAAQPSSATKAAPERDRPQPIATGPNPSSAEPTVGEVA